MTASPSALTRGTGTCSPQPVCAFARWVRHVHCVSAMEKLCRYSCLCSPTHGKFAKFTVRAWVRTASSWGGCETRVHAANSPSFTLRMSPWFSLCLPLSVYLSLSISLCVSLSLSLSASLYLRQIFQMVVCVFHMICPLAASTRWRRPIGCLKLQVIFGKRASNYRALLRKMTYTHKASYISSPPCSARSAPDGDISVLTLCRPVSLTPPPSPPSPPRSFSICHMTLFLI